MNKKRKPQVVCGTDYGRFYVLEQVVKAGDPAKCSYRVRCRTCGRTYVKMEKSLKRDADIPCNCEKTLRNRAYQARRREAWYQPAPYLGDLEPGQSYGRLKVLEICFEAGRYVCLCRCSVCGAELRLLASKVREAGARPCRCRAADRKKEREKCGGCGYAIGSRPMVCMYLHATGGQQREQDPKTGECLSRKPWEALSPQEQKRMSRRG